MGALSIQTTLDDNRFCRYEIITDCLRGPPREPTSLCRSPSTPENNADLRGQEEKNCQVQYWCEYLIGTSSSNRVLGNEGRVPTRIYAYKPTSGGALAPPSSESILHRARNPIEALHLSLENGQTNTQYWVRQNYVDCGFDGNGLISTVDASTACKQHEVVIAQSETSILNHLGESYRVTSK